MLQLQSPLRQQLFPRLKTIVLNNPVSGSLKKGGKLVFLIRSLGVNEQLDEHEIRKLAIFNQLCFFQLLAATVFPLFGIMRNANGHLGEWPMEFLPSIVMLLVLLMNAYRRFDTAFNFYFLIYPVVICIVYLSRIDLGIELSFVLCGILSVFFLRDTPKMVFVISFSMVSYFVLFLLRRQSEFPPQPVDNISYLLNEILNIVFIFYALFLIMKENVGYQFRLLRKNRDLHAKNLEIEAQQREIEGKALLLKEQKEELEELDKVKNKLFSIVSHDLKAPMYALRTLFQQMAAQGFTAEDLQSLIPSINHDLNYSTALVENLLEWAKSQMQSSGAIFPRHVDVNLLVDDTVQLLMPQIKNKNISLTVKCDTGLYTFADENMIRLVFRNLLSNAIKFTPENGEIIVGANDLVSCVEVYVKDSGKGISREEMKKINQQNFYSTHGTKNESGTGLGLMLCKEFLAKHDSRLLIESEPGFGSTFSFALNSSLPDE